MSRSHRFATAYFFVEFAQTANSCILTMYIKCLTMNWAVCFLLMFWRKTFSTKIMTAHKNEDLECLHHTYCICDMKRIYYNRIFRYVQYTPYKIHINQLVYETLNFFSFQGTLFVVQGTSIIYKLKI